MTCKSKNNLYYIFLSVRTGVYYLYLCSIFLNLSYNGVLVSSAEVYIVLLEVILTILKSLLSRQNKKTSTNIVTKITIVNVTLKNK